MSEFHEAEHVCEIIGVLDIEAGLGNVAHARWLSRENVVDGPSSAILFNVVTGCHEHSD